MVYSDTPWPGNYTTNYKLFPKMTYTNYLWVSITSSLGKVVYTNVPWNHLGDSTPLLPYELTKGGIRWELL